MSEINPNTMALKVGAMLDRRYEIQELLGAGGFGNTYLARDTRFSGSNVIVCVKEFFMNGVSQRDSDTKSVIVTDAEQKNTFNVMRERFHKEAERMCKLSNEHIVRVSDLFDENNTSYYVMDYVEGHSLEQKVARSGFIDEQKALSYLRQLLEGLQVIHKQGMVHLDIKPSNVMINNDDKVVLIDFGASKIIEQGSATLSAAMLSTPGYAPLEQALCHLERIGVWTDLYAVGGTLFKLLTGKTPAKAQQIIDDGKDAFLFPPHVSTNSRELIYWMMSTKISQRPHSDQEVIAQIDRALSGKDVEITKDNKPTPPPTPMAKPIPTPSSEKPQTPAPLGVAVPKPAPAPKPQPAPQQPAPMMPSSNSGGAVTAPRPPKVTPPSAASSPMAQPAPSPRPTPQPTPNGNPFYQNAAQPNSPGPNRLANNRPSGFVAPPPPKGASGSPQRPNIPYAAPTTNETQYSTPNGAQPPRAPGAAYQGNTPSNTNSKNLIIILAIVLAVIVLAIIVYLVVNKASSSAYDDYFSALNGVTPLMG